MRVLKQSTQVDVLIGPLIDDGDFKAVEESVAYNATGIDVDVIKGVTKADVSLANSSGDGYWRHVANGYYAVTLSTTDTGTLGPLRVTFEATGVLPCWEDFLVVPANVYDAMVAGTDYLKSDAVEISSSSTAADAVESNIGYLDASIAGLNDLSAADVNAEVDTALADYDPPTKAELDSGLSGLNDISAADVWANSTRTLTALPLDPPSIEDIDARLSATHGAGSWDGGGSAPTVEQIDSRLSSTHGAGSWLTGSGESEPGRVVRRYRVTKPPEGTGTPIPGVYVLATSDAAGVVRIADGFTDDNGVVSLLLEDGVTYYLWRSKNGHSFTNPDVEIA